MAKRTVQVPQRVTQSPIRLEKAENPREFPKRIKHLDQGDIEKIGMSIIMKLLVAKGIVTQLELQQEFLDEMERRGL